MLYLIAACECAFWIVLVAGLLIRYLGKKPRLGLAVLAMVPLVDLVLLVAVLWHVGHGGTANVGHALAAFYLGFSLAYGRRLIAWLDVRIAHRWAGGPAPDRLTGWAHARQRWADVCRTALACGFAAGFSALIIWWIGDPRRTEAMATNFRGAIAVLAIEVIVALSYTLFPRSSGSVGKEGLRAQKGDPALS